MTSDPQRNLANSAGDTAQTHTRGTLHLLYHELTPAKSNYSYALSTDAFRDHLAFFRRIRASNAGTLIPEITFDDGHISNFEQALPLLSSFGLKARFFITAGWTANRPGYMSWDQLRQLQQSGQDVGAHGWSHALLTHCSEGELDQELRAARLLLEDKLGIPITTVSLPGGRFNAHVLNACKKAGYTQVFSSIPRAELTASAPLIGRLNLRSNADVPWLDAIFAPGSRMLRGFERQYRLKDTAKRTLGDGVYAKLWALLNRADPDANHA